LDTGSFAVGLVTPMVGDYSVSLTYVGVTANGVSLWVTDEGPTGFTIHGIDFSKAVLSGQVDWIAIPNRTGS